MEENNSNNLAQTEEDKAFPADVSEAIAEEMMHETNEKEHDENMLIEAFPEQGRRKRLFFYIGLTLIIFIALSSVTLWLLPQYKASSNVEDLSKIYFSFQQLEKNFMADTKSLVRAPEQIEADINQISSRLHAYVAKTNNDQVIVLEEEWKGLQKSLLAQKESIRLLKMLPQLDYRTTEEIKTLNKLFVDLSIDLSQKKTVSLETIRAIDLLAARSQLLDANVIRLLNMDDKSQLITVASLTENINLIQAGLNELFEGNPMVGIQGLKGLLEEEVLNEAQLVFSYLTKNITEFVRHSHDISALKMVQKQINNQKDIIQNHLYSVILDSYEEQLATTKKISLSTVILGMLLVAAISLFFLMIFMLRDRLIITKYEVYTEKERNKRHEQALFQIIENLDILGSGDLSVRAIVTDDTTGVLADSLNIVIENFSEMLLKVQDAVNYVSNQVDLYKTKTTDNVALVSSYNNQLELIQEKIKIFERNVFLGHQYLAELINQGKLVRQIYAYFEQVLDHDAALVNKAIETHGQSEVLENLAATLVKQKEYFRSNHESFTSFEQLIALLNDVFSEMVDDNTEITKGLIEICDKSSTIFDEVSFIDQYFSDLRQMLNRLVFTVAKFNVPANDDDVVSSNSQL